MSNHSDLYTVVKINVVNIKASSLLTKPKGSMGRTRQTCFVCLPSFKTRGNEALR